MFRGENAETITRRLMLRGWPEPAARAVAAWLTDRNAQPPRWHELTGENDA